jgi:serine kinase of HPr protein (carbohydrate metabolism regulator)
MKVSELAKRASLSPLNECGWDKEIEGVYISDMVSDVVTVEKANRILVTLQTHKNLIAAANLVDVAAIVFARGRKPPADVVELAKKAGIALFVTDVDTWSFAVKLHELGVR